MAAVKCPACKKPLRAIYESVLVTRRIPIDADGAIQWDDATEDSVAGGEYWIQCEYCRHVAIGGVVDEILDADEPEPID